MTNEEIERELTHTATREQLADLRTELQKDFGDFKTEMQKTFGDFKTEIHKAFGDFKTDLLKTIWLTQLLAIGIILVGVGLLLHFKL